MLHKQAKNLVLIQKSAEISPHEIRSLLEYERGQCAESSHLKAIQLSALVTLQRSFTNQVASEVCP